MSRCNDMDGFTLIELMITLVLLSIAAAIAIPSFGNLIRTNQLQAQAEEVKAFIQHARSEAVTGRAPAELSIASNSPWEIRRAGAVLRQLEHQAERATLAAMDGNGNALSSLFYYPSGTASGMARFTICRDQEPADGYLITVEPSGNIKLHPRGKDENNTPLGNCQ